MNKPLVSISCITYNHEKYIADALDSFLMQKTNFDFEILIHDDASTDGTANIIREYEKKYPNVIKPIYQTENQYAKGVKRINYTFNDARANGKYIALCEGDDYWTDPYKLQKQVDYMEKNDECSMCFHPAAIVSEDKKKLGRNVRPYRENCIASIDDMIIGGGGFCATASIIYRKKLGDELPKFFMNAHVGDFPLQLILADKGYVYYIDEFMSAYRTGVSVSWSNNINSGNDSKEKNILNWQNDIELLKEFDTYTNHKYKEIIEVVNNDRIMKILLINRKKNEIKKSRCKDYYRNLKIKEKLRINIKYYFPNLSKSGSRIKKYIKVYVYNLNEK